MTCGRSQEFLAKNKLTVVDSISTQQKNIPERDALKLVSDADTLYVAKRGGTVVKIDLRRDKPTREELSSLLLGRYGNLRVPTVRIGRTLIVGFDEATYRKFLL